MERKEQETTQQKKAIKLTPREQLRGSHGKVERRRCKIVAFTLDHHRYRDENKKIQKEGNRSGKIGREIAC